jgi:hypothetical protein
MYPNPQEALPLSPRPSLAQYRKLAKDLVHACRSGEATAIRAWATRWIGRLGIDDIDGIAGRVEALPASSPPAASAR